MVNNQKKIVAQCAMVIHPYLKQQQEEGRSEQSCLEEAEGLALAIDLDICFAEAVALSRITPATYLGRGKVEAYAAYIEEHEIDLCIMDTSLTPIQQRNLEEKLKCKVIDRTALILEIFGARARTHEGRLQVELAAFEYQKSRLVRSWTHLERQRGGGGFMGGPGEKQIESDRRALAERILAIKRQLDKVVNTRELHRKSRKAVPYPIVSLVGYTNAGKSTLFNRLTGAAVMAKDQLFATLDPTMRQIKLPSGRKIILSDTVGFISNLPTQLVAAFRATLEEVIEADIILHVRDISHVETNEQKEDVLEVLSALGVDKDKEHPKEMVEVHNKIDLLPGAEHLPPTRERVQISALTGEGCDELLGIIDRILAEREMPLKVRVSGDDGKSLAWVRAHARVISEHYDEEQVQVEFLLELTPQNYGRLLKREGIEVMV